MIRSRISSAIAPVSIPGAIVFSIFSPSRRFCMSEWIASAIPGYWTLTATSRPSGRVARCTWPIDADAIGVSSKSAKMRASFSPRSCSITLRIGLNDTGLASCCRLARISWNCGRISSGTSPRSTADSVCPTFIAAPRIPPSTLTSACADFSCWRDAASLRASEPPPARIARAVASRAATPAAVPVIAAARLSREPRTSSSLNCLPFVASL